MVGTVVAMDVEVEAAEGEVGAAGAVSRRRDSNTRTLSFAEVESEDIRLLEVDSDEMLACLTSGGAVIKAVEPTEKVVLCTSDKTFAVKSVETSNALFMVEDPSSLGLPAPKGEEAEGEEGEERGTQAQTQQTQDVGSTPGPMTQMAKSRAAGGISVCTILAENWEMEQIAPDFTRLDDLLRTCAFGDDDEDEDGDGGGGEVKRPGFTMAEILERVQASESEVLEALQERRAMQVGERWCMMGPSHLASLVDVLVSKISERKWAFGELPLEQVLEAMAEEKFAKEATLHCLRTLGRAPMFLGSVTAATKAQLDTRKVCRHYARKLLRAGAQGREQRAAGAGGAQTWKLSAFMAQWHALVPVGMEPEEDMLSGLALFESAGSGGKESAEISYLDAEDLPRDPEQRFDLLFGSQAPGKPRWEAEQLRPFLEGMTVPPGKQADDVLEDFLHGFRKNGHSDNPLTYIRKTI